MKYQDLSGLWNVRANGLKDAAASLPGTLDENKIGTPDSGSNQWHPDEGLGNAEELMGGSKILTRLTRNYTYEGPAYFSRRFTIEDTGAKRVFLEAERSRELTLKINGRSVPAYTHGSVSTPYVFEITGYLCAGENECELCCDNSYPSWPREAIVFSSAATDETQTNWNGLLGYLRIRLEKRNFLSAVRVYPKAAAVDVVLELDCADSYTGVLNLKSPAFAEGVNKQVSLSPGRSIVEINNIRIAEGAQRWDEEFGVLYDIDVNGDILESCSCRFGLRAFGDKDGKLALNGRHIFLRSEANCCVFPETGHMPMSVEEWKNVLEAYRSYGVNCMRFHSHCPPGAAFDAADEMGMLMQPELSHWNPRTAFEDEKSWSYYQMELRQILLAYANHPSFVMLTLGNELCSGALGYKRMGMLVETAKRLDNTRLYSNGSNNFCNDPIGPDPRSDFYTAASFYKTQLRGTSSMMTGHINNKYPDTKYNFSEAAAQIRGEFSGPVFGFEVGQFEVLPDFDEWEGHTGVTIPDNYAHIRGQVEKLGFLPDWKKRAEASGELALLSYREEVESVMRTEEYSGLSLLGLQDFPGQGTALVGMLNAHLKPKPFEFARPERFRQFFSDLVPLVLMDKYTYLQSDVLSAEIKVANYTKKDLHEPCIVRLMDGSTVLLEQKMPVMEFICGKLSSAGEMAFSLEGIDTPKRLTITASIAGAGNDYPVWVYPDVQIDVPEAVLMTQSANEALRALMDGKNVFLTPKASEESFPRSIKTQFTTDFWSVGTFTAQDGFMGCMMDPQHPVFSLFPTEFHSNWQWWPMCRGRAMILPDGLKPLVTALDCYARMRNMGMLLEAKVGGGKLMLSSMGLMENAEYPEARMLIHSILTYMSSNRFSPGQELSYESIRDLIQ